MKVFLLLLTIMFSHSVWASCISVPHEKFAKKLSIAHQNSRIDALDTRYSLSQPVKVFIEHSIGEEESGDTIFIVTVASFKELYELLQSRQVTGFPAPASRPFLECANGICSYDFNEGIMHNQLYLTAFRYRESSGCLVIESISFLDGD